MTRNVFQDDNNTKALAHLAQAKLLYQQCGLDEEAAEVNGLLQLLSERKEVKAQ